MSAPPLKALFLDRDGTLIKHVHYLCDPAQVVLLPGVAQGLRRAREAGVSLYLHTNQSGVGRGLFPLSAVHACNERMIELLDLGPAPFAGICIAPERPDEASLYRKPSPRFAFEVAASRGWQCLELCYIGDRASDLAAGWAAGAQAIGVSTGGEDLHAELRELGRLESTLVFAAFAAAIDHLLNTTQA